MPAAKLRVLHYSGVVAFLDLSAFVFDKWRRRSKEEEEEEEEEEESCERSELCCRSMKS